MDHRVVDECFQEKLSSFWERAALFPVVNPFYSLVIGTEEKNERITLKLFLKQFYQLIPGLYVPLTTSSIVALPSCLNE